MKHILILEALPYLPVTEEREGKSLEQYSTQASHVLEVKGLRKSFEGKEVLHGVDFQVSGGSALGLLGRNGAGKTTTMRIIMDVFHATKGEILMDGETFRPTKHSIGYLPEERGLYPKRTVSDQMIYLARLRGLSLKVAKENTVKWLKRLELLEYEKRKLETLSKGNQQKVQLASTMVTDPEIVILDEPFSGLDPVNSQILKDVVNEQIAQGKLVIFSSHQMSYVEEFCDQIALIDKGEVVLKGRLRDIKKEFGRGRLSLSAENYSPDRLEQKLHDELGEFVKTVGRGREYLIIQAQQNLTKKDILARLLQTDIDIAHFGQYEPSLNEIFVEKVGDEPENQKVGEAS
jgi:ABC-2 type transport system ATP-binding protein